MLQVCELSYGAWHTCKSIVCQRQPLQTCEKAYAVWQAFQSAEDDLVVKLHLALPKEAMQLLLTKVDVSRGMCAGFFSHFWNSPTQPMRKLV